MLTIAKYSKKVATIYLCSCLPLWRHVLLIDWLTGDWDEANATKVQLEEKQRAVRRRREQEAAEATAQGERDIVVWRQFTKMLAHTFMLNKHLGCWSPSIILTMCVFSDTCRQRVPRLGAVLVQEEHRQVHGQSHTRVHERVLVVQGQTGLVALPRYLPVAAATAAYHCKMNAPLICSTVMCRNYFFCC